MQKQIDLFELISILGLPNMCLDWLKLDYHNVKAGLREFKKVAEKQRCILALKHHPDRHGGSLETMKAINEATDILLALRIQPPLRMIIIHEGSFHFWSSGGSMGSATTASAGSW